MSEVLPAGPLQRFEIERRARLSADEFYREYLSGAGRPVIVTDATDRWTARSKWTFELFKSRYGSDIVTPTTELSSTSIKVMRLADYIDYLDSPLKEPAGFWIDKAEGIARRAPAGPSSAPLGLFAWNFFFKHPELLEDIEPSPYFGDDWVPLLPEAMRRVLEGTRYRPSWLLIGPAGSLAKLHHDFLYTHAYLAQICGRKKCILFSPEDSEFIYHGAVDPERPDFERFPLFKKARAFACVLEPGEMLLIPSRWWHQVTGLEKWITVSYNFFNRANFGNYFADFIRQLPDILERFEKVAGWRAALGVEWACRGFTKAGGEAAGNRRGSPGGAR
ncbi:MAG TPA: cupin-like domain-containing protein [Bryobacterales bacterium]|nr:cupin-like domain-containing protein [Bryobacterales bacterium]